MSYLENKVVHITGASSGLGEYLARELVRRGAQVGLLARRGERLQTLAEELTQSGGRAAWAEADVTDGPATMAALDRVSEELGGADVVVANAGYGHPELPRKHRAGTAEAMYDVNLFGMLRVIDWALPRFLEQGSGHLVGVASLAGYMGMPNTASYCGSKAAMRVHLQALRVSLKRQGVAVTTICPGFVESELTAKNRYKMPFLWPTERAARVMADAIEKRRGEIAFPWQMHGILGLLRRLPTSWVEALIASRVPG